MSITTLIMLVGGFLLLYGAVKNKNPLEVIRNALTGKDIQSSKPLK